MRSVVREFILLSVALLIGLPGAGIVRLAAASELDGSGDNDASFPAKTVRLIEPFGAGGGPDVIARVISPKLAELWGQPVIVESCQLPAWASSDLR